MWVMPEETMNIHQIRQSDAWEPPEKNVKARTWMGTETVEIAVKGNPNTRVRSDQIHQLGDWR